jgi:hypothetical protein
MSSGEDNALFSGFFSTPLERILEDRDVEPPESAMDAILDGVVVHSDACKHTRNCFLWPLLMLALRRCTVRRRLRAVERSQCVLPPSRAFSRSLIVIRRLGEPHQCRFLRAPPG